MKAEINRWRVHWNTRTVERQLKRMAESGKHILVGPWLSEVGFELLYWIPFLRWAVGHFQISPDRITVISRGGVENWYRPLAGRYVDIFDLIPLDAYRQKNYLRGLNTGQKQFQRVDFDEELLFRVRKTLRLKGPEILHPSLMFNLFRNYWDGRGSQDLVHHYTRHAVMSEPENASLPPVDLPDNYVAARFYFNTPFPDSERTHAFITKILEGLSRQTEVVLLNTGLEIDDHREGEDFSIPHVHNMARWMTARNNLAVQTAVISRAKAFLGSYGGLCYLPLLCGIPTISFYDQEGPCFSSHLKIVENLLLKTRASFEKIRIGPSTIDDSWMDGIATKLTRSTPVGV